MASPLTWIWRVIAKPDLVSLPAVPFWTEGSSEAAQP